MIREIPLLSVTLLKSIAKAPLQFINEDTIERAFSICPINKRESAAQILVDYIAEAGRMTDDVKLLFPSTSKTVSVRNAKLSGKYILNLTDRCQYLADLDISGCFQVTDETIGEILRKRPGLKLINFRNCRKVTDLSLRHVVEYGNNLISVNVGGNFNITGAGISEFLDGHQKIESFVGLHLSGLPLTDDHLLVITRRGQSLTAIGVAYANISEQTLKGLLQVVHARLEHLCISWTTVNKEGDHFSNAIFEFLARSCPRLVELEVNGLRNVSVTVLQQLVDTKISKAAAQPDVWLPLKRIAAKFTSGTRQQFEQFNNTYFDLKIEA
eukprot:gene1887-3659_t